jgi:hypothetical protein
MRYFFTHNELDVFLYGELKDNQVIESGQPFLEFFNTDIELNERLSFFGQYFNKNNIELTSVDFGCGFGSDDELGIPNSSN